MRMMMAKWRHVPKPSVWKLKMITGNSVIKALRLNSVIKELSLQNMSCQSSGQKLFIPVQYQTFALKLNKYFLRLWYLLHFQTFYYYLTLSHGQKMTLLALAIARSTSWLNIIWHFWKKKNEYDVSKISSEWTCLMTYIFPMLHNSPSESYFKILHWIFTNNEVMVECQSIMHIFEILMTVPFMNAIVEHLFSQMNRFKADFCNRL